MWEITVKTVVNGGYICTLNGNVTYCKDMAEVALFLGQYSRD